MKKVTTIVSISFAVIGQLSSGNSEAKELPLSTWKSIMNTAKAEYKKGNITGACTHATNVTHFIDTEIYKVRNNKQLHQDVMFLMQEWQTYVGKYCGGKPLAQKSKLGEAIKRQ